MAPRNSREFEFTLGKLGLVIFSFGISLLLLFSFLFGVMVGKNIDSYPEKIARGIPHAIKEKIIDTSKEMHVPDTKEEHSTKPENHEKEELQLTFYDSLTKKADDDQQKKLAVEQRTHISQSKPRDTLQNRYVIQIASFKEKGRMEVLRKKLTSLGYRPRVDVTTLATSGRWYRLCLDGFSNRREAQRVSTAVETNIRGIKCLIIYNK